MQLSSFWKPEDEILSFHQVQTPRSRIGYCKLELNLIQLIKRHYSFNVMCPRARPDVWNERVHLLNWKPTLASTHKYTHTHTHTHTHPTKNLLESFCSHTRRGYYYYYYYYYLLSNQNKFQSTNACVHGNNSILGLHNPQIKRSIERGCWLK